MLVAPLLLLLSVNREKAAQRQRQQRLFSRISRFVSSILFCFTTISQLQQMGG
jgi:hypothetical protein